MPRFKRVVLSTVMAVGLLGGAVIPVATALAASCGGSAAACDHTSPQTTGCSADAVTKKTVNIIDTQYPNGVIGKVELRYSPSCRTAWSRVWITASGFGTFSTDEYVVRKNTSGTTSDHRFDSISYNQSAYSHQLYVNNKSARACAFITNGTVASGEACTSYVAF